QGPRRPARPRGLRPARRLPEHGGPPPPAPTGPGGGQPRRAAPGRPRDGGDARLDPDVVAVRPARLTASDPPRARPETPEPTAGEGRAHWFTPHCIDQAQGGEENRRMAIPLTPPAPVAPHPSPARAGRPSGGSRRRLAGGRWTPAWSPGGAPGGARRAPARSRRRAPPSPRPGRASPERAGAPGRGLLAAARRETAAGPSDRIRPAVRRRPRAGRAGARRSPPRRESGPPPTDRTRPRARCRWSDTVAAGERA